MILILPFGGEFSAPLTGLHGPWWNRLARAMA